MSEYTELNMLSAQVDTNLISESENLNLSTEDVPDGYDDRLMVGFLEALSEMV